MHLWRLSDQSKQAQTGFIQFIPPKARLGMEDIKSQCPAELLISRRENSRLPEVLSLAHQSATRQSSFQANRRRSSNIVWTTDVIDYLSKTLAFATRATASQGLRNDRERRSVVADNSTSSDGIVDQSETSRCVRSHLLHRETTASPCIVHSERQFSYSGKHY